MKTEEFEVKASELGIDQEVILDLLIEASEHGRKVVEEKTPGYSFLSDFEIRVVEEKLDEIYNRLILCQGS